LMKMNAWHYKSQKLAKNSSNTILFDQLKK